MIASGDPDFSPGDVVTGSGGWQDLRVAPLPRPCPGGAAARKSRRDCDCRPGWVVLGMPGFTAWIGLLACLPAPGETVVVGARRAGAPWWPVARLTGARIRRNRRGAREMRPRPYSFRLRRRHRPSRGRLPPRSWHRPAPTGSICISRIIGGPVVASVPAVVSTFRPHPRLRP